VHHMVMLQQHPVNLVLEEIINTRVGTVLEFSHLLSPTQSILYVSAPLTFPSPSRHLTFSRSLTRTDACPPSRAS